MRLVVVIFLLVMSLCFAGESVYVAVDPEPTAEETLILEFMNRFRADPSADADRIAPGGVTIQGFLGNGVDWDMFKSEMKALKSVPPLVFNLSLLDAARKHSQYMVLNGLTHDEDPSKPGFVAANFGERMRKAGYNGGGGGENCFRDAMNPWHSHAGFVVDFGPGGTGGMQPGRGHRTNMINAGYREIGCSALSHGSGRFSVTHNFGSRRGSGRLAGGVIYFDRNGNNFYDIGEGIGGVKISVEGTSTATWKSGAYALELKSDQALTITAEYAGQAFSRKLEPGKENIKFDWVVPEKVALEKADQLLGAFEKLTDPNAPAFFKAQVALAMGTRGLNVDEQRRTKITHLVGDVGTELESHQSAVSEALKNLAPQTWSKILSEHRKLYGGTQAEAWFREAEMVANIKLRVADFEKATALIPLQERKQFAVQLEQAEKQLTDLAFKQEVSSMATKLKATAGGPQTARR